MKTCIGIGLIAVVTVAVAAFLVVRDSGPEPAKATTGADGALTFMGEGNARTEPLDIRSGRYLVLAGCGDEERFAVTMVSDDESERLLSHTGSVSARVAHGSTLDVDCSGTWAVTVMVDPMP